MSIDWDVVQIVLAATFKICTWLIPAIVFGAFVERRIHRG